MPEFSLYNLSLLRTAHLIVEHFWDETEDSNIGNNSFSCLPSSVVEDLIDAVLQIVPSDCLQVSDLYLLVTSGRLQHFKLENLLLVSDVLVSILMCLSVACQNLRSITLQNIICSDTYNDKGVPKQYVKSAAVECVLMAAPHLELVESCIPFDLKALKNCTGLKILRLNFVSATPLYNFLEGDDGHLMHNDSLRILDVFEDFRHSVSYTDIAIILKYCRELTEINCDISRSLDTLHGDELEVGVLERQYKLRKCVLGSTFLEPQFASASLISVHIATLTCPLMEELDILVNDHNTIYALSDFLNLKSLLIQWESITGGDFSFGAQLLLDKIGINLKALHLLNFSFVNFSVIGKACPSLENLKVEYQTELPSAYDDTDCTSFRNLKSLSIESMDSDYGLKESTLRLLLSNCKDLTNLFLQCACLNDNILKDILLKNSLCKVKDVQILDCSLSGEGVRCLVSSLTMLDFLHFNSTNTTIEEAASIVHDINPHVIIRSDVE